MKNPHMKFLEDCALSYEKNCADPAEAAEKDLLGRALSLLFSLRPDWWQDDEGMAPGSVAGEFTWRDIRAITKILEDARKA